MEQTKIISCIKQYDDEYLKCIIYRKIHISECFENYKLHIIQCDRKKLDNEFIKDLYKFIILPK